MSSGLYKDWKGLAGMKTWYSSTHQSFIFVSDDNSNALVVTAITQLILRRRKYQERQECFGIRHTLVFKNVFMAKGLISSFINRMRFSFADLI